MGFIDGLAKEESEVWASCSEARLRSEREIQLEATREQENSINRWPTREIKKSYRMELIDDPARPVFQHVLQGPVVDHCERKVKIRPAISVLVSHRSDDRPGDDSIVGCCKFKDPIADPVTLKNAEQFASLGQPKDAQPPPKAGSYSAQLNRTSPIY